MGPMRGLFNLCNNAPKQQNLEPIVSIHVPRTAGTSFKKSLEKVYGKRNVLTIYQESAAKSFREDNISTIPKYIRVIHGHIPATRELVNQYPHAKLITWLRDPVERAISHYYYWKQLKPHGGELHNKFLLQPYSIIEFIKEFRIDKQAVGLFAQVGIDQFDFVGAVEDYSNEMDRLKKLLQWKKAPTFQVNASKRLTVSQQEEEKIKQLMKEEYELYNFALKYKR